MGGLTLFARAHAAAGIGTLCDLALFWLLIRTGGLAPAGAVAVSATLGACVNFALARHWVFHAAAGPLAPQAGWFALGALASIALNTACVALTVHGLGWPPLMSRIVAAGLVAAGFNFPFQRYVVFRLSDG